MTSDKPNFDNRLVIIDLSLPHGNTVIAGIESELGPRNLVKSELNISAWIKVQADYWGKELMQFVKFGFPLDSNRQCNFINDTKNIPLTLGTLMTSNKPNFDNRLVIIDLSLPYGNTVIAGIGSEFALTFPTVDHITNKLKCFGPGSHLFKIDINRVFRYIRIDPSDLLGLCWDKMYNNTCLPLEKAWEPDLPTCQRCRQVWVLLPRI